VLALAVAVSGPAKRPISLKADLVFLTRWLRSNTRDGLEP